MHIDRISLVVLSEREVVQVHDLTHFLGKLPSITQITESHAATRSLVFIGRTNTTPGGANFGTATGLLSGLVKRDMVGQYQRASGAQLQPRIGIDTLGS